MPNAPLTAGERLRRQGQATSTCIENLIVIGASAGGYQAVVQILKSLSADMPTAVVILLHSPLGVASNLKEVLGPYRRTDLLRYEEGLRKAGLPE